GNIVNTMSWNKETEINKNLKNTFIKCLSHEQLYEQDENWNWQKV
ncbi:8459_t:CDS:1, partial [Gigaspora rosea]